MFSEGSVHGCLTLALEAVTKTKSFTILEARSPKSVSLGGNEGDGKTALPPRALRKSVLLAFPSF
jgi:hypothetical protein